MAEGQISRDYISTAKKIADFVLGFFGFWIINVLIFILLSNIIRLSSTMMFIFYILLLLLFILEIIIIIFFFKINRRYISIGIISGLFLLALIPLLVIGACFGMFAMSPGFF